VYSIESSSDSGSSNELYNINNNSNSNNIVNNSSFSDSENRNNNISDNENNSTVTNNVVNSSINENRVNLTNFLNNKCVNIYVRWYRLYNFLLGERDAGIIDINYKKEWFVLFKDQIISGDYSKTPFLVLSTSPFTEIMPRANTRQGLAIPTV